MRKIQLTKGKYAIVDNDDFGYLNQYKWFFDGRKAVRSIWNSSIKKSHNVSMHRFITEAFNDEVVDHVNHNPLDNRRSNLRLCNRSENQANRATNKNRKYKGVGFKGKLIRAYITMDKKTIHLGYFKTLEDAARAYNDAAKNYYGEFACLNKIK